MAGKIEIFTDAAGRFRWRLKAGNGEIIANSRSLESKSAAMADITKVRANLCDAGIVDQTVAEKDPDGNPSPTVTNVTNNYHGPVVQLTGNDNSAKLAWNNSGPVNQGDQANTEQIAPGYEQLAIVITNLLANLPVIGLGEVDQDDVQETAGAVLTEVTQTEPNQSLIRRSVAALKGYLSQVASGAAQAATEESVEIARAAIEGLGDALPF